MDKNLFLGGIELLKVFNIISVSNQSPLVTWQGPEIINYISFKADDFYEMSKIDENVLNILERYIQT